MNFKELSCLRCGSAIEETEKEFKCTVCKWKVEKVEFDEYNQAGFFKKLYWKIRRFMWKVNNNKTPIVFVLYGIIKLTSVFAGAVGEGLDWIFRGLFFGTLGHKVVKTINKKKETGWEFSLEKVINWIIELFKKIFQKRG